MGVVEGECGGDGNKGGLGGEKGGSERKNEGRLKMREGEKES